MGVNPKPTALDLSLTKLEDLRPGWIELVEISPLTASVTCLLQTRKNTWKVWVGTPNGVRKRVLRHAPDEPSAVESQGDGRFKYDANFGAVLTFCMHDPSPRRFRSNLSTYLLSSALFDMRLAIYEMKLEKEGEHVFKLTPAMVKHAFAAQIDVGEFDGPSERIPRILDIVFNDNWPECRIKLDASGELTLFGMSNGEYDLLVRWGAK